jgi:hypothetical protein
MVVPTAIQQLMQTSAKEDDPEKQIQFALRAYVAQLREVPERFEGDLSRGAVGSCTTTSVACIKHCALLLN